MGEKIASDAPTLPATAAGATAAAADDAIGPGVPADRHALTGRALLLAWIVSVLGHVVLFLVMFLTPWLTSLVGQADDLPLPLAEVIGPLHPKQLTATPSMVPPAVPAMDHDAWRVSPKEFGQLTESFQPAERDLSIIGIGTGGGDLDTFGLGLGDGGSGPTFFGMGGEEVRGVRRIVYVVDRSGSMITTFDLVKEELRRSVTELRRSQQFHVIFFNAGAPVENPPKRLVAASRQQRESLFNFLETIRPQGGTDPSSALRAAFAVEPDLIYFLTDGVIPEPGKVLNALDQWNADRRVRVYTFAFISREGHELLERIAREHHGEFKFISEDAFLRGRR